MINNTTSLNMRFGGPNSPTWSTFITYYGIYTISSKFIHILNKYLLNSSFNWKAEGPSEAHILESNRMSQFYLNLSLASAIMSLVTCLGHLPPLTSVGVHLLCILIFLLLFNYSFAY